MACLPLTHSWLPVESFGRVVRYRCSKCGKTRIRIK